MIDSCIERHGLPMSTFAACLRSIGWIDSNILPASFFRFAEQFAEELRPTRVNNAFCQTMVVNHAIDTQIFHSDHPRVVHNLAALLMGKIVASLRDPLMDSGKSFPTPAPFGRSLCQLAVLALHLCQRLLFFAEKARIGNLNPIRKRSECFESHINANGCITLRQAFGIALNRKRSMPLAGTTFVDRECLDFPFDRTMIHHFDMPNSRESQLLLSSNLEAELGKGEAVVSPIAFETGIAWVFACFDTAKECLESQIKPHSHILQDLRMDYLKRKVLLFQSWKRRLLLVERRGFPCLLVGITAVREQVIIQPSAFFQHGIELCFLIMGWIDAVLKHLTHTHNMHLNRTNVKRGAAPHPIPRRNAFHPQSEGAGLSGAQMCNSFTGQQRR